ncbi:MAG: regulatory protein RecX [Nitrospinota bacterium]
MRAAALRLLSRRAHTRSELREKLRLRGFGGAELDALLGRFAEIGYLNDAAAARAWARRRLEGRPMGRRLLREDLHGRGIAPALAEEVLAECYGEGEEQRLALRAARKRLAALGGRDGARGRLLRHLQGRGFPAGVCIHAAQEALGSSGDGLDAEEWTD